MGRGRVQATIFLPRELATTIDDVRRRWNPIQAERIAPHLTVLHHARSARALSARLGALAPTLAPFELRLGRAARWPAPDQGIYVTAEDPDHRLRALRSDLVDVAFGSRLPTFTPHVTLVYARTVHRDDLQRAWAAVHAFRIEQTFTVRALSVVESDGSRWSVVDTHELGNDANDDPTRPESHPVA